MLSRTRTVVATALTILLALPFASAQEQQEVTITLWTHDKLYVDFFTVQADEWKENYPDIDFTFDFQVVPEVFDVALANLAAGEEMPDLIGLTVPQFPRFMEGGIIEDKFYDLTDWIGDDYDRFAEGRWAPYTYQGRVYGVESALSAVAYFYQPAVFERYGLEVPTTWDELLAAGDVLAAEGMAIIPIPEDGLFFQMLFYQRGGLIFDEAGEFVFGSEENRARALDVLELIQEGYDRGSFAYFTRGDYFGAPHMTGYQEGRIASAIMPDWFSDYMLKPQTQGLEGEFRITTMPVWADGEGHTTSAWGGTGFAISRDSENPELVWDLLRHAYLTEEGQIERWEQINYLPTMIEAYEDPRVVGRSDPFYGDQTIGEVFAAVADDQPVWYQSQFLATFNNFMVEGITLMLEGELTPEEVVDDVILRVEDEIDFFN